MRLTRDQAIAAVGLTAVLAVESGNVDFTSRLTDGTPDAGYTEFSCSANAVEDGQGVTLTMYVLVETDEVNDCEELDEINWDSAIQDATYSII